VANKLVLVGDLREPTFGAPNDRHSVRFGKSVVEQVPGCYLKADSIAGLLDGHFVQLAIPPSTSNFMTLLGLAIIACVLPIRLARSRTLDLAHHRSILSAVLFVTLVVSMVTMLMSTGYWLVQVSMAGYVIVLVMLGSFWVEFVRNRHRIAERTQQSQEGFGLTDGGTITLPTRRQ
jgi:uncharacterized membrane protein